MTLPTLLFVYGTLMRRAARAAMGISERERLWAESTLVGDATIHARLYDFGAYPGLVLDDATGCIVHGEVLDLTSPAETFAWLDAYEMIVPGREEESEYARRIAPVAILTADGRCEKNEAWVYVTRRDVRALRPLEAGRWM